jgi:hypothetical protein
MSIGYVMDEFLYENTFRFQLASNEIALRTASMSFLILTAYQVIYIVPVWSTAISSISNMNMVIFLLVVQFFADLLNIIFYYDAISKVGATATGVIQGVNTILGN